MRIRKPCVVFNGSEKDWLKRKLAKISAFPSEKCSSQMKKSMPYGNNVDSVGNHASICLFWKKCITCKKTLFMQRKRKGNIHTLDREKMREREREERKCM